MRTILAAILLVLALVPAALATPVQPVLPRTRGGTAGVIPNCPSALTYNTTTKLWGCNLLVASTSTSMTVTTSTSSSTVTTTSTSSTTSTT